MNNALKWMRGLSTALALTASLTLAGTAALAMSHGGGPSGDPAFLPEGATLEKLVDGEANDLIFAEGPVVTCDGMVMWSDITFSIAGPAANGELRAGNIMEYDPSTKKVSVFR